MFSLFSQIVSLFQQTLNRQTTPNIDKIIQVISEQHFTFAPSEIAEIYNQFHREVKDTDSASLKTEQQLVLQHLKGAFEILDQCKGKDKSLTAEHIQKMEPTMLEKVQYNLKIAVNKLLDLVKQEDKKYDLNSEKVTQHYKFEDLIKGTRAAAAKSAGKTQ